MRARWILLKIRHKQYGVNVDDVGLDVHIEPHNPISDAMVEKSPLRQCRFRLTGARPLCRCATSPRTAGSHPLQGGQDFVTDQPPLCKGRWLRACEQTEGLSATTDFPQPPQKC